MPHLWSTGNHDSRKGFREALGSGHLASDGGDCGELLDPTVDTRAAITYLGDLRIITLDSLVPGETHGRLDDRQLGWLSRVLASPTRLGTVLVLHHPPLVLPAIPYVGRVALRNASELEDVIRGTDVRAILTGHLHFQASGYLDEVPVWVTPGVVPRIDTTTSPYVVRGALGASATIVDLGEPVAPTFQVLTARDPRAGEEVRVYDAVTGVEPPADL